MAKRSIMLNNNSDRMRSGLGFVLIVEKPLAEG
jgi:hypothetical protein